MGASWWWRGGGSHQMRSAYCVVRKKTGHAALSSYALRLRTTRYALALFVFVAITILAAILLALAVELRRRVDAVVEGGLGNVVEGDVARLDLAVAQLP